MRRRAFIERVAALGVAWPLAARAQQQGPVIGLITSRAADDSPQLLTAIRQGLRETGFVEGQNVTIEYRFAGNQNDRLPALAADLVHRQVNLILATTTTAAVAAKAATTSIPIVFEMGSDPVRLGLIANLNRPGGNITGITQLNVVVAPKRLEVLHDLMPNSTVMALLIDLTDSATAEATTSELRAGGLVVGGGAFFTARGARLGALALRYAVPTVYEGRAFVTAGGLMSYGANLTDSYHLAGIYAGRVLKGEKPGDLPVQQSTKLEMFLNLKTAKALGITVPLPLSGRADEVIE